MKLRDARRLVLLALVLVGLVAFARGPEHHRGSQQVGAFSDDAPTGSAALA